MRYNRTGAAGRGLVEGLPEEGTGREEVIGREPGITKGVAPTGTGLAIAPEDVTIPTVSQSPCPSVKVGSRSASAFAFLSFFASFLALLLGMRT